jgi:hypothetical protein
MPVIVATSTALAPNCRKTSPTKQDKINEKRRLNHQKKKVELSKRILNNTLGEPFPNPDSQKNVHNPDNPNIEPGNEELNKQSYSWPKVPSNEVVLESVKNFMNAVSHETLAEYPCCVCAGLFTSKNLKQVLFDHFKINFLTLLLKPGGIVDTDAFSASNVATLTACAYIEAAGCNLDNTGINVNNVSVCTSCYNCLSKNKLPALAIANGNYYGDIPNELKCLTICEQVLVSNVRAVVYAYSLRDGGGRLAHSYTKSNCVAFL